MLLGAHVLDEEKLPKERQEAIQGIMGLIDGFREEAFYYQKSMYGESCNQYFEELSPTNFISILGDRGSGKTSTLLTIHKKLRKQNEQVNKNIILDIVDPAKFNVEENALGWIIYLFQNKVNEIIKKGEKGYCDSKTHRKELKEAYDKLKDTYVKSRPYFRGGTGHLAEGTFEYKKINEEIIFSDMNLDSMFRKFIDSFVNALKKERCQAYNCDQNQEEKQKKEKASEPVVIVTFDDIDISPEHGYEILRSVLNYLKHPSIVVIMLGKYKTFKEGAIIDSIHREKLSRFNLTESYVHETRSMIDERKIRAEEFIEKVLPFSYRYDLEGFGLEDRLKFPYAGIEEKNLLDDSIEGLLEKIKIYEDMESVELGNVEGIRNKEDFSIGNLKEVFYKPVLESNKLKQEYEELNMDDRSRKAFREEIDKYFQELECVDCNKCISVYTKLIFEHPRGLMNLQQRLKKELNEKLYYNNVSKKVSYSIQQKYYDSNFDFLYKLYKALKNNVEIIHGEVSLDKIFKIDKDLKRVIFNFEMIDMVSNAVERADGFKFSEDLLIMAIKGDDSRLSDSQSAFIQFFYDLSKSLLSEKYIRIRYDKQIEGISIYTSEKDYVDVKIMNFNYFYEYYLFQSIFKMLYPIILKDRKVHRNIRDRLKVGCFYILDIIKSQDFIKSGCINMNTWISKSELNKYLNKELEKEKNFITQISEKYNIALEKKYFKDGELRIYDLLEYVMYFEEIEDEIFYNFKEIIEENDELSLYSSLGTFLTGSLNVSDRMKKIESFITDKYKGDEKSKNDSGKDELVNDLMKSLKTRVWDEIKEKLYSIRIELLQKIVNFMNIEQLEKYDLILWEMKGNIRKIDFKSEDYSKRIDDIKKNINITKERLKNNMTEVEEKLDTISKDLKGINFEDMRTFFEQIDYYEAVEFINIVGLTKSSLRRKGLIEFNELLGKYKGGHEYIEPLIKITEDMLKLKIGEVKDLLYQEIYVPIDNILSPRIFPELR